MNSPLILASKSPRRRELLSQLGYHFTCISADIDESVKPQETPFDYVARLAFEKADAIASQHPKNCILGSDTCVVVNGEILGQPQDKSDCLRQLSLLSGKSHEVLTGVTLCLGDKTETCVVKTTVFFKTLTTDEMLTYWETGEPQDKAGSYGIQGVAGQFVTHINGSYSAVVGLPLYETAQLLQRFNMTTTINSAS